MKMQPQTKLAFPRFQARLALGLLLGVALAPCLLPQATSAQTAGAVQPLEDFQNKDGGTDLFSDRSGNGASSLFDLMHRAAFGGMRSADDYGTEQQQNLNDAAAQFRAIQLQRLKQQKGPASRPSAPATTLEIAPATGTSVK
ncbi:MULTISPECIES: hypothetical protein [Trichocoleus]|uniref:Uncharacterized protein n=1 Tax=Trichocoleus desertorum GB2-A4 TaxID=2933944 RepID=A0ABV0J256_9CYAN|nr:hypothetical protein [Trichocoleus sp. FACHB-46]MBD1860476.1 hypothetical protein [Trichocoleus sp. FACHB-46]